MYCYNRGVGKKLNAAAMQATAADSLSDCAATAAVLLSTLVGYFLHWQIDGWCGLVVSLLSPAASRWPRPHRRGC